MLTDLASTPLMFITLTAGFGYTVSLAAEFSLTAVVGASGVSGTSVLPPSFAVVVTVIGFDAADFNPTTFNV